MNEFICQVSIAPVRQAPNDRSEMITQLLFGERCTVIENQGNWRKIKISFDGYEGWIDSKQLLKIQNEKLLDHKDNPFFISVPFGLLINNDSPFPVPIGAEIPYIDKNQTFELTPNNKFEVEDILIKGKQSKVDLINIALKYINTPYLWGGKSTYGIDCSGFTQMVYKISGYKIPRDAAEQAYCGEVLSFIEEAEPGDLAFFENEEGKIIHVGFIMTNQKILHAHGKVRIDMLDHTGIFNLELNKYTHWLRFIRRIF